MGADFSRVRFNPLLDYAGVELEQGRVLLDADVNELMSVRPYRRTWVVRQVFVVVARAATSAGVPNRAPRVRGRPERPVRGGGSSCSTEVTFSRLVQVIRPSRSRRRSPT